MKLISTVVLLAYLAFTPTYGNFHSQLIKRASETSEEFINSALVPLEGVSEKIKSIISKGYTKINEVVQYELGSFNSLTSKLETTIDDLKEKYDDVSECIEKFEPEIIQIKDDVLNGLKSCARDFIIQLQNQSTLIREGYSNVVNKIGEFRLQAINCVNTKPVLTTRCLFNQINAARKQVDNLTSVFNKAVDSVSTKTSQILDGILTCKAKVINEPTTKINKILENVNKCVKQ